jgi:hypothetical protein
MVYAAFCEDLRAWITRNAATGEWTLIYGPVKHDVADPSGELCAYSEERMARKACHVHNAPLAE